MRKSRAVLGWIAVVYGTACLFLLISEVQWGHRSAIVTGLSNTGQSLFALPLILFAAIALFKSQKKSRYVAIGAAMVCTPLLTEYRWNFPPKAEGPQLKVMTYNVDRFRENFEEIIATIKREDPDIVCLQEDQQPLDEPQYKLLHRLSAYENVQFGELCILSKLPVLSSDVKHIPPIYLRPILEADVLFHGERVRILNVHLVWLALYNYLYKNSDWIHNLPKISDDKVAEERILSEVVGESPENTILCGDFNGRPVGPDFAPIRSALKDSFAVAGKGSGFTIFNMFRCDYIMAGSRFEANASSPVESKGSDHLPLVSSFNWR